MLFRNKRVERTTKFVRKSGGLIAWRPRTSAGFQHYLVGVFVGPERSDCEWVGEIMDDRNWHAPRKDVVFQWVRTPPRTAAPETWRVLQELD